MTKKSQARMERDMREKALTNEKLENRCWDDLRDIHAKCQMALNNIVSRVTSLYSIEGLGGLITNRAEVAVQLRGLAADRTEFQNELNAILSLHSGRTGGSEDSYMNREALDIFESYRNWQAKFEAVFVPTVEQLIAVVAEVGQRIANQKNQETPTHQPEAVTA